MSAQAASELAARIDELRRTGDAASLTAMLAEESPLFAGRGTNEVERLRGYVLASFESAGLPAEAVPFVLEELETGHNPYTVAGAARALRGADDVPAEAAALLAAAIERLQVGDDVVAFDRFEPGPSSGATVTVLGELAETLALLQPRGGSCCSTRHAEPLRAPNGSGRLAIDELELEDQDARRLSLGEAFAGRPTALGFFYTRCNNPQKCSLTVTRLGQLARRIDAEGHDANVAGVTYDPRFDRPERLRRYGLDRGVVFSERCLLLRTAGPFDPLQEAFGLGVGFGPVTVNRHRLDLVVLDPSLAVAARFERRLWDEDEVVDALRAAAAS